MTQDEADAVGAIIGTADGGCSTCVARLVGRLNAAKLGFVWATTGENRQEQPDWSDDPEDKYHVGLVVIAARVP
jgi:hypothetical protein